MLNSLKTFGLILAILAIGCSDNSKYSNSVISSPHPLASETGKLIFSKGGNAFDAAVAASFTLTVVEPSMSGIGGRLQVIYKQANGNINGIAIENAMEMKVQEEEEDMQWLNEMSYIQLLHNIQDQRVRALLFFKKSGKFLIIRG